MPGFKSPGLESGILSSISGFTDNQLRDNLRGTVSPLLLPQPFSRSHDFFSPEAESPGAAVFFPLPSVWKAL